MVIYISLLSIITLKKKTLLHAQSAYDESNIYIYIYIRRT